MRSHLLAGALAVGFAAAAASTAHAAPMAGSFALTIWNGPTPGATIASSTQQGSASNPLAAGSPLYTGIYTGQLNFVDSTVDTIGGFLATGGGTLTAPLTTAQANSTLSTAGFTYASLFEFTFTTNSSTVLTVTHDDGFSIWNAGNTTEVIAGYEGPTTATPTTFSLAAGTYNLWYAEANGLPADLVVDVPEPVSIALLGLGLTGLGLVRRRAAGL